MNRIVIRKGKPEDANHFVELDLISAPDWFPYLFGLNARDTLRKMFLDKANWFSYRHTYFVEVDNQVAGMGLAYSYNEKYGRRTTFYGTGFNIFDRKHLQRTTRPSKY